MPNSNVPNITLKHSPFAALYQLEKEQLEEQRQERTASSAISLQVRDITESVRSGRRGVDVVRDQDEEDKSAREQSKS